MALLMALLNTPPRLATVPPPIIIYLEAHTQIMFVPPKTGHPNYLPFAKLGKIRQNGAANGTVEHTTTSGDCATSNNNIFRCAYTNYVCATENRTSQLFSLSKIRENTSKWRC